MTNNKSGYSLAEAAVVISALSLCVGLMVYGIAFPEYKKVIAYAKAERIHKQMRTVINAYEEYCTVEVNNIGAYGRDVNDSTRYGYIRPGNVYNECHPAWPGKGSHYLDFLVQAGYLDNLVSVSKDSWTHQGDNHFGIISRKYHFVGPSYSSTIDRDFNGDGIKDAYLFLYGWTAGGDIPDSICAAYNDLYTDWGYQVLYRQNLPPTDKMNTTVCSWHAGDGKTHIATMFKSGKNMVKGYN